MVGRTQLSRKTVKNIGEVLERLEQVESKLDTLTALLTQALGEKMPEPERPEVPPAKPPAKNKPGQPKDKST